MSTAKFISSEIHPASYSFYIIQIDLLDKAQLIDFCGSWKPIQDNICWSLGT